MILIKICLAYSLIPVKGISNQLTKQITGCQDVKFQIKTELLAHM